MKFDIVLRFTARAFVHGTSVDPSARSVAELGAAMGASDWISRQALGINLTTALQVPAIQLVAPAGDWTVQLSTEGYDVQYQQVVDPTGKFSTAPTFRQFLASASSRISAVLTRRDQKVHRIAAVQEGLLANASSYELKDARSKLVKVPAAFADVEPFEWDYRVASRVPREFGGRSEITNTISTVKVAEVKLGPTLSQDRLLVATDVNTTPRNQDSRFVAADITAFLEASFGWHSDLFASTLAMMGRSQ